MNCDKASDAMQGCNISPVRENVKHQMTPLKTRQKTSRRDQGIDVHTTCSTPNAHASKFLSNFNSPSGSIPYSQENYPDVIWDYTSPKLPKGSKRREIKITIEEFLKNLAPCKAEECGTQSAHYIKLLENWMTKQNTGISMKKTNGGVRKDKRRSRRVIEEIKQFMESIQGQNVHTNPEVNSRRECLSECSTKELKSSNLTRVNSNRKSFLEGDDDSTDELWGEADNSFIVKATQELEYSSSLYTGRGNKNSDVLSTIPETIYSSSTVSKCPIPLEEAKGISDKKSDSKVILDSNNFDHCTEFILSQFINCDWDSGSDNDDWDKGFLADDTLNLVPDEALLGNNQQAQTPVNVKMQFENVSCSSEQCIELKDASSMNETGSQEMKVDTLEESEFPLFKGSAAEKTEKNSGELFNNFDDESFGDESVLCKPEILSWIDEVENKLSQSQKCSAVEIERKKDEALRRRQKKQLKTKS